MPYYKFKAKDVIYNTLKTYPEFTFDVWSGNIYLNNEHPISGNYNDNVTMVPSGHVSLYELNVGRNDLDHTYDPDVDGGTKALIYPFVTKDGNLTSIGTITSTAFNASYKYGDILTGSYPMSASISRKKYPENHGTDDSTGSFILALKNTLNDYVALSPHYQFSSSLGDKSDQELTLISIPSIFFDAGIKKGSVDLKFYISGTLAARAQDLYKDGTLVQTSGTTYAQNQGADLVAGVVLYDQGFLVLTGSWDLTEQTHDFGSDTRKGQWLDFAAGANDGNDPTGEALSTSASFQVKFQGTNPVSTITMLAHAQKGYLNNSSNPTFKSYDSASLGTVINSGSYIEPINAPLFNTISSSFCDYSASFKKQTFISKVGIFDEDRNLLAIAKVSKPVKKLEDRDYTFKLKLDI